MTSTFRSLTFGLTTLLSAAAMAQQPYTWVVTGVVTNCYPGQTVDIQITDGVLGNLLVTQQIVVDPGTCTFGASIGIPVNDADMVASTQCAGLVITYTDSAQFNLIGDSAYTSLTFDCGGGQVWYDCNGILNGPNMPGTSCTTFFGEIGTWSANCVCEVNGNIIDCLGVEGGTDLPGTACDDNDPTTTTSFWSVDCVCVGDSNVFLGYDCLGIMNGPNVPGAGCTIPGTILQGIWSLNCACETNDPVPCEANFWVMQAYGDTTGNPNGLGDPIPNVLWVWNLNSGGTGDFSYLWEFGDGESSTEAYPTHTYASGAYNLCLTITDLGGTCTSTYCDSVSVDEDGMISGMAPEGGIRSAFTINVINPLTTGVTEQPELNALATWPNPVTETLNIQLTSSLRGSVSTDILDLSGRTVVAGSRMLANGANRLSITTSDLTPGVYVLRIGNDSQAHMIQFVKTR